jgi:magnesium transporter
MIKNCHFLSDGTYKKNCSQAEIADVLASGQGFTWISLERGSPEEITEVLEKQFHFHPLAIEDSLSVGYQIPKVDDYGEYIFIIFQSILLDGSLSDLPTVELDLFLGKNYLVTCFADASLPVIDNIWQRIERDTRMFSHGPDFFCHSILDNIVDDYMPLIDQMESEIDWIEDTVVARPNPDTLAKLISLKHGIMTLRRIISPQREVINRLARDEFPQVSAYARVYFRDIYDHLIRIQDLTDAIRDIVSGSMDIYLNSTSLRLNEVMKALTIVSTIFLPLSFVAGVFGMNFRYIPGLESPLGFWVVSLIYLAIAVGMLAFFKFKHWF